MEAISSPLKKMKEPGTKWLLYVLIALFAIVILGSFLSIPYLSGNPVYSISAGLVLLLGLILYGAYADEARFAKLSSRVVTQVSGADAGVKSLRRNIDESNSDNKRSFALLETNLTNVGDGVTRVATSLTGLQQDLAMLQSQLEELSQSNSALRDSVASAIEQVAESEASSKLQAEQLGGKLTGVTKELTSLEGKVDRVALREEENKAGLTGISSSLAKLDTAIAKMKSDFSSIGNTAAATDRAVGVLGKRTVGLEKKLASIGRNQVKVAAVGRKLAKAEVRVSRVEKKLSKLGHKAPEGRRRSARGRAPHRGRGLRKASEPALPVPEEVQRLEPEPSDPQESLGRQPWAEAKSDS